MESYSVLMSVYDKETPSNLRASIQSMLDQTVPFHDFVLVCDGPLNPELDQVISEFAESSDTFTIVRLKENQGLGPALNAGLPYCQCELIARMDSDDLSLPDRCARQLQCFLNHPELSIVSGFVTEFASDPLDTGKTRTVPEHQKEIKDFAAIRSPFNHPCVMYRKSMVLAAGSYPVDFPYFEDYALWIRMLGIGAQCYNIQEPLLLMRGGAKMYQRRGGMKHYMSAKKLYTLMLSQGFISRRQYYKILCMRLAADLMPGTLRRFLYQHLLRH
jgi:glycosyltransferase involved in cell wall biosynthesis